MKLIWISILILIGSLAMAQQADRLNSMVTLVTCKTPGKNPLKQKTRVFVKKAGDGRVFGQVEATKFGGTELRAHSPLKEKRAEGTTVPVEYEGQTIKLLVSDKTQGGGWGLGTTDYVSQIAYTDLAGANYSEVVHCSVVATDL